MAGPTVAIRNQCPNSTPENDGLMSKEQAAKLASLTPMGPGVTEVDTGTGLTGGPITTTGTIALADTAVTPGSYTNANVTVDQQGRITAAADGVGGGTVTEVDTGTGLTGGPITTTGTVALANTAVTPGSYDKASITVDQQGRITAAAAGVVTFPEVADALGTAADPNVGWVFKSDGAGSGTMQANTQSIPNYFTVGTGGDVDFNTIEAAINACILGGAGPGNAFIVDIFPGFYLENPLTLPFGILLRGDYDGVETSVIVFALNPNEDLVTIFGGGSMSGMMLMGVSDPLKCLVRIAGIPFTSNVGVTNDCVLTACSNGVIVDGSSMPVALQVSASLRIAAFSVGLEVGTGITCIGPFCQVDIYNISLATSPTEPYIINPIQTGVQLLGGAQLGCTSMLSNAAFVDNTQVVFDVNDGSTAIIRNPFCVSSNIVFQIGASGSNSLISIVGGYLVNNTTNFNLLSATGIAFVTVIVDMKKSFITPGATLSGLIQNLEALATDLAGASAVEYGSERQASLPEFVHSLQKSGLRTGGDVTDPAGIGNPGLDVTVGAGTGWIVRDAPVDVINVVWPDTPLTLPGSQPTVYIYIDDTTLLPAFSTTTPSASKILLAIAVTDGAIQYIHNTKVLAEDIGTDLQDYLLATQKLVLNRGLAAVAGSTVRKFTIDTGLYYRSLVLITYAGATDATFDSFYGNNGATEITGVTDIDITNYDNAGVLTPMTAGWYRSDSVYITSDGQVSVIYGTQQFLLQADAANQQISPPMSFISETAFSIATLIVEQGNGIVQLVDQRVVVAKAGAASITVHGQLSGLSADDHPQYLLASGGRAMAGNLDMDGNQINNVLDINTVVIENHHVRHQPGGADAIPTAVPVTPLIGTANAEGTAATLARADHQHGMTSGAPSTIGAANVEGASSSPSRLDHIHAHGNQAGGSTHALAVASGANGYLSGADKAKLDGLTPGAAVASVSGTAPIVSSGGTTPAISITNATDIADGSMSAADKTKLDGLPASAVPTSRTLTAGTGMTGGGDLSADRTFNVVANADGSIIANADDIQVGILATDAQHGNRGGGGQHANVVAAGAAGFMTGADKTKLDGIASGATNTPLTASAPVNVTKAAAVVGVATDAARSDHKHDITTAAAVSLTVGGANAEGSATSIARSDHTHALPAFGTTAGTFAQGNDARIGAVQTATTNVSAVANPAPSAGQVLTALSGSTAQWSTPSAGSPTVTPTQATGSTTTVSASDSVMSGMTVTPAAGTYMVWFSGDIAESSTGIATMSIYSGGVQVAASARQFSHGSQAVVAGFDCMAKVTVNGAQAIEGRWKTSSGTATNTARQLYIMQVI